MAKQASRQVSIFVNSDQAVNSVKGIAAALSEANNRLAKMVIGSDEYLAQLEQVKKYRAVLQDHNNALRGVDDSLKNINKHQGALDGVGKGWMALKNGLSGYVGLAAGAFAVDSIIAAGTELFKTGVQMESLAKKARTVFGEALPQITAEAEKNATAMGLTTQQYVAAASAAQDLLVPMGFQRKEAANISAQLINLSGALSEWTGGQVDSTRVSEILTKALLGEREELKSLGISISEADVQAALATKGLDKLTGATLEQAKASTTLELILAKSTDAQAQFAKETDSAARRQAEASAKIAEIAEKLAVLLLPVFEKLITLAGGVVEVIGGITDGISAMINPAEAAADAFDKQQESVASLESNISPLLDRYDELTGKTILTKDEQDELKKIITQVGDTIPTAIKGFDEYGRALGLNTDKAREFIVAEKARLQLVNKQAIDEYEQVKAQTEAELKRYQQLLSFGKTETAASPGIAPRLRELNAEEIKGFQDKIQELQTTIQGANAELDRLRGKALDTPPPPPPPSTGGTGGTGGSGGTGKKADPEAEARAAAEAEQQAFAARYAIASDSLLKIRQLAAESGQMQQEEFAAQQQQELNTLIDAKEQQRLINLNFDEEQAAAAEQIRLQLISDQEWETEQLNNHYAHLLAMAEQYGLDTSAIKEQQSIELKALEKEYADQALQDQQQSQQVRLQALQASFSAFGDFVTASFELLGGEGEKAAKFQKLATLAQIAFDTASAISSLVAASNANPTNAVTFGAAGIAQYVSGFARIIANIAQAKKILTAAPEVKQKAEGGYMVTGASDGRTYNASMINTPGTGLLPNRPVLFRSNATGGPVLASERGQEYFVAAHDLANPIVANYVHMIDSLTQSGGRVRQFADGGAVSPTSAAPAFDPAIIARTGAAIEALVAVLQSGVVAVLPDRTIVDMQKRFKDINAATGNYY
jgi:hypothetical protein